MPDKDSAHVAPANARLLYRPNRHSDWGEICLDTPAEDGYYPVLVRVQPGFLVTQEEMAEHRAAGTDPYEEWARYIIRAVNAHAALVESVERLIRRLEATQNLYNDLLNEARGDALLGDEMLPDGVSAMVIEDARAALSLSPRPSQPATKP